MSLSLEMIQLLSQIFFVSMFFIRENVYQSLDSLRTNNTYQLAINVKCKIMSLHESDIYLVDLKNTTFSNTVQQVLNRCNMPHPLSAYCMQNSRVMSCYSFVRQTCDNYVSFTGRYRYKHVFHIFLSFFCRTTCIWTRTFIRYKSMAAFGII